MLGWHCPPAKARSSINSDLWFRAEEIHSRQIYLSNSASVLPKRDEGVVHHIPVKLKGNQRALAVPIKDVPKQKTC